MPPFTAIFSIEAGSLAEAEAAVGEWVVTPDTTLMSLMGTVVSENVPLAMPDGGTVADGATVTLGVPPEPPSGD